MKILKNILLATDFSKSSEVVLDNAINMAKIFQSKITPIYVIPKEIENKKAKELLKDFALKELKLIKDKISNEGITTTEAILEHGSFSDKIVETGDKINANIIIIGAGEKVKGNTYILGSNAEKIIKKSNKPVYVVKNEKQFDIKKILCPVDFSNESKRALKNAITLAHKLKAKLVIFTVYEISHLNAIKHKVNIEEQIGYIRVAHEKEFDSFLESFELVGLNHSKEIGQGAPAVQILKAIEKHKSDLLIIGTKGKSGISRMLMGSVTEKVIRKIPSSFVTIKNKDLIILELTTNTKSIQEQYQEAQELFECGFYEASIHKYKCCLDLNFMHLPSLKALSIIYKKLDDKENESKFKAIREQILDKLNNEKIETEIRKYKDD